MRRIDWKWVVGVEDWGPRTRAGLALEVAGLAVLLVGVLVHESVWAMLAGGALFLGAAVWIAPRPRPRFTWQWVRDWIILLALSVVFWPVAIWWLFRTERREAGDA